MFQPENQKYVMNNEHVNVTPSSIIALIFLSLISLFLFCGEVLFAAPFSSESEAIFDSKLEVTAEKIKARLLENESEVVIAVVDLVNYETQERDTRADALEEQLTNILIAKLPNQVVPYYEIVYLRLEWKSRFPDILHDPLTEDIAKLSASSLSAVLSLPTTVCQSRFPLFRSYRLRLTDSRPPMVS